MTFLSSLETPLFIPGPAGDLEAVITRPQHSSVSIIGIVAHPHPLYGGTMNNKVVTTVVRAFQNLGLTAIRFNYRGVGKSAGQFGNAKGETEDLLAIIAWANKNYSGHAIWLAGFSFGAYVAACASTLATVKQLITIAPAVNHYNFNELPSIEIPWLLIQGEDDEIVPVQEVFAWANSLAKPPKIIRLKTGHFFHGYLTQLRQAIEENLPHP